MKSDATEKLTYYECEHFKYVSIKIEKQKLAEEKNKI